MATRKVKVLRVVSRKDRFRRAGHEFGTEPKDLPLDTLSAQQQAALKGDPNLVVVETEVVIDDDGNVVRDVPAALDDAEERLREWATELNGRANDLKVREDQVAAREKDVEAAEVTLAAREATVVEREAGVAQAANKPAVKGAK
ncbi:hypothetical protein ACKI2N_002540 [Cupriavidus sp. 30B13]|uniref:hypothetical protein n=1 Tax=Cupriavidus sp. 30B13 TaxID=3384241 RepID=UPI003B90B8C8